MFTSRRLVALNTFSDLVSKVRETIRQNAISIKMLNGDFSTTQEEVNTTAYADAVATYLSFAVDRCIDYWSSIATWHSSNQQVRCTFARQAISMTWDYIEANPFSNSSGGWISLYSSTIEALQNIPCSAKGVASQIDATSSEIYRESIVVSTDPPYYDNICYADLSDFFYVWLRRSLSSIYPELFSTLLVPKEPELVATPYRFNGKKQKAKEFFETGLKKAFQRMRKMASNRYPLTIYYAFKQTETEINRKNGKSTIASTGWETMLEGLIQAGFSITGTLPMRSEQHHRMIANNSNALASSIALVCRPRPDDAPSATRRQFLKQLQKEFAADLWQVYLDDQNCADEYRDPTEFFRRTYLTEGLKDLLTNALIRLSGKGGDLVIELQTNFGGGKTHAMLALYHLCFGVSAQDLPGCETIFNETEIDNPPPNVKTAIIVGNKISPGTPDIKRDGIEVKTLWGEIAYQLGGKEGYAMVADADRTATNPGDKLKELFNRYSPCLILVDEWVAYARQLHYEKDLPGGDFDTHFTFSSNP